VEQDFVHGANAGVTRAMGLSTVVWSGRTLALLLGEVRDERQESVEWHRRVMALYEGIYCNIIFWHLRGVRLEQKARSQSHDMYITWP
jgi:hypothetical protein